uniref:ANK_REP_REGION domain-containing protein n=1 Tax=Mesocestoides corti TaxID=53468 RepID=A0A5K3EFU1_MESCO
MSVMQKSPSGRRQHRHGRSSVPNINTPLLNADSDGFGNQDSAFYGLTDAKLSDLELAKLIQAMRSDDAEAFETFTYESIQTLGINVALIKLPCADYMASAFWKTLHKVGLLHLACILSAHSIIDIILKHNVLRLLTNEDVSAVHVCSAMGDYVGLRKLLKAGYNPITQDKMGRTPLHYAAQTNLPAVVMLLARDITSLHVQDNFGKLAEDFCQRQRLDNIRDFLFEQSKAPSTTYVTDIDDLDMDFVTTVEMNGNPNTTSLALHFEAYLCTRVNPLYCYRGQTYCECCDEAYNHEEFSGNPTLDNLIASRNERFIKRPTNTFGQFETPCSNVMAEFVRMTDDTPMEDLEKLFFHLWNLRKPGLVLTLHGSVPVTKMSQRRCYNLIFNVFQKTLTWIITDGQYGSVAEVMSMGMSGYSEAYGLKRLQAIGIVPWRRLPFQSDLRSLNYMGSTQVSFPQRGLKSELHTPLAPFHTRYLFIDSGAKNDIHCIQDFRTRFEVWLSKVNFRPKNCTISHNTPVCGLLVSGRPEDALGVCEALKQNIPFVVVADSGGLASIIEQYLEETKYMQEMGQHYADESTGILEPGHIHSTDRLTEIMLRYWENNHITDELISIVTSIMDNSHLMQFFFSEYDIEDSLNGKIVSALINPALFQDVSKKYSWKPRLKLAMELNQTDIVLEEILADSQLTTDDMAPFAKSSLLTNKLQFLRLLCDAGLNLYEFSDQKTVEELFTIELNRNSVGGRALKQFFQHYNSKVPVTITVETVDQNLNKMMSRKCLTLTARNERRPRCIIRKIKESISNQSVDLSNSIQYQKECESYVQYLYLWSLASNRFEIAQYLLTMLTDITAAALFGASFLRRKARIARSLTDRDELKNYSLMFEDMALSVLNQCYASNVESTMQLLIMERRSFGKLSCFMLAAEGNCKNFMEHQACQEYLDRVWAHTLLVKASSFQFFLSLFVGAICPPIIPFVAEYDETRYSQNPSNSDDEILMDFYRRKKTHLRTYKKKLFDFYKAPCVLHAYQVVAYFVLFCLFALNLQFEITFTDYGWMAVEICVIIMATAHFIDFVRTAFTKWISWRVFLGRRTNQFVLATFFFYGVGVTIQVLVIQPVRRTFALEQFGRICIIFAASFPYQKLLLLLSINRYIGPKLQMIRKMVVRDLLPFLVIVLMFWTLYTIVFSAIILRPSSPSDVDGALSRILRIMRTGFFQMFGEFDLEELLSHYERNSCKNTTMSGCTYPYFKIGIPFLLSLFTLTTHVLLINLLIAIFTKTYDDMEAVSQQLWTMQRYVLMDSVLTQPTLPVTFTAFTQICLFLRFKCGRFTSCDSGKHGPFQKSFQNSPARERQLINWEKLNALIALNDQESGDDPKRKNQLDGTSQWFQRYATRGHQDKRLNVIRRLLPRDITIQSLSQARMKKTVMEQKIDNIDRTLESIMSLIKSKYQGTLSHSPSVRRPELPPSLITSRQSLGAWNEGSEAPTSFQWHNHQLAFYATINADVVPHTLDPPVPWEEPFPDYVPLRWNPDTNLVPAWQVTVDQLSPRKLNVKRLSQHMLSVDSTALTFASSGSETIPRNPEGRVGTSGKGILPQFGENPACVVVVTRTGWANVDEFLVLKGARVQAQFPWFLCRHERDCSQISCFKEMVRAFCQKLNSVASRSEDAHSTILRKLIGGYNKHVSQLRCSHSNLSQSYTD